MTGNRSSIPSVAHPDTKIMLRVERDGAQIDIPVTLGRPRRKQGTQRLSWGRGESGRLATRDDSRSQLRTVGSDWGGARRTWTMSLLTLDSLKKMLFGELSVKNLSGPITIAKVAGASAQSGVADFLNFLAYLSISLGVLNLLPIPVLDGGICCFI